MIWLILLVTTPTMLSRFFKDRVSYGIKKKKKKKKKKSTDCQNYLNAKSARPLSLEKSIPYSQEYSLIFLTLRIKRVWSALNTKSVLMTWFNDS